MDNPVQTEEIRGDFLRTTIHKEYCCGIDEFIKLYAYSLPEEIIVHLDIDVAFYKPMDHLYDAILFDKDSPQGIAARQKIEKERKEDVLPEKIGAFITRDWGQVAPSKFPPGYQAGFLVARRDETILPEVIEIIKEGNYTEGLGNDVGWYNSGHGGYVGAKAMQGLMAYYYDHVRDDAVELNMCRYNHMGMDTLWRSAPNFWRNKDLNGKCRNGRETCEQCKETPIVDIYNVHYTLCRKPWQCMAETGKGGKKASGGRGNALDPIAVNPELCLSLQRQWHSLRTDLEDK